MVKITLILIIITSGCLLLSACVEKPSVVPPQVNEKSASPSVTPTQEKAPVITPVVNVKPVSPTFGTAEEKALVITQDMKGKSVSLQVGDTFEVQIPTIPTAGFEWQAKDLDTSILFQVGDPAFKADTNPNAAGGIVTLKFKAVGAGKTILTLLYLRSSENGVPALYKNSFGVTIEVK